MTFKLLRKLARDFKWQYLYKKCKDFPQFNIFENGSDLSRIQLDFLQWLELYSIAETDLITKKPFISKEVIEDDMRLDAYFILRRQLDKEEENPKKSKKQKVPHPTIPSMVFKKG